MANRQPSRKPPARRGPPPRRTGSTLTAVVLGAALGAGAVGFLWFGDSADERSDVTTTTLTTAPPSTEPTDTTSPPPTTPPATSAPAPTPTPTSEPAVTTTTQPPLREIVVIVGRDDGPERIDVVPLGSTVELRLTNPDADDEFHVHGYDLGGGIDVPAGETLTLNFVADRAGLFEVESHITNDVLVMLLVE